MTKRLHLDAETENTLKALQTLCERTRPMGKPKMTVRGILRAAVKTYSMLLQGHWTLIKENPDAHWRKIGDLMTHDVAQLLTDLGHNVAVVQSESGLDLMIDGRHVTEQTSAVIHKHDDGTRPTPLWH